MTLPLRGDNSAAARKGEDWIAARVAEAHEVRLEDLDTPHPPVIYVASRGALRWSRAG